MATPVPRPRPRTLLLATDLSVRCDRAFDRAVGLATAWDARLIVVTVVGRQSPDSLARGSKRLDAYVAGAAAEVETMVAAGDPAEAIAGVAADHDCGLIICGIPHDETLARLGLGSTVDRLLRGTGIPLLIVRQRVVGDYRSMVAGTDFSSHAQHALETAAGWFPSTRITLLHAFDLPYSGMVSDRESYRRNAQQAAVAECEALLARTDIPAEMRSTIAILAEHESPEHAIGRFVDDFDVDLVVLGSAGRSAALEFLVGNTATQVMSRIACDALIIRHEVVPPLAA